MKHLSLLSLLLPLAALAAESADNGYLLIIEDHRFKPVELVVPAGKKIRLRVENRDSTPEEFESHALNREKVVPARATAAIFIGPLSPGRYPFFGEFNEKTAQGTVIAH